MFWFLIAINYCEVAEECRNCAITINALFSCEKNPGPILTCVNYLNFKLLSFLLLLLLLFFELLHSNQKACLKLKKKLYGPFFWMGFNCLKARATSRRQFTFTTKFPEISGTHFTDLGRMKGWVDLGAT